MIRNGEVKDEDELRDLNRRMIEIAKKFGKIPVATGDVHFIDKHEAVFRRVLKYSQGFSLDDEETYLHSVSYTHLDVYKRQVPPLDGWGVISSFLPYKFRDFEIKYENIGYLVLIVLLVTNLGSYITSPLVKLFWSIVVKVTGIY